MVFLEQNIMPTSNPILLTPVMNEVLSLQPKSVLDIGVGFGKFGALIREYTDIWNRRKKNITIIHGVEIFKEYKNPNWEHYDYIYDGDIAEYPFSFGQYDMILFLEVLEHIEKKKALELLNIFRNKCKVLLFSYTNSPQGEAFGNIHETHLSIWRDEDFNFDKKLLTNNDVTYLYKTTQ